MAVIAIPYTELSIFSAPLMLRRDLLALSTSVRIWFIGSALVALKNNVSKSASGLSSHSSASFALHPPADYILLLSALFTGFNIFTGLFVHMARVEITGLSPLPEDNQRIFSLSLPSAAQTTDSSYKA